MQTYICTEIVQAEPMTADEYNEKVRPFYYSGECRDGYKVVHNGGFTEWCPKEIFEQLFKQVEEG